MKKVIASVIIVLFCAGIVYLGILIFNSRNVKKVELVGNVQTLYMVDEKLDFEDAKLKVTYRDGEEKLISLKDADVKVKNFSTSLEKHGTMHIVYKSNTIKVDYDVLKYGLYYIKNSTKTDKNGNVVGADKIYDQYSATEYFYVGRDGVLDYYLRKGSKTIMYDGAYETAYKYYTKGDKLVIEYGEQKYEIFANYISDGYTEIKSEIVEYSANKEFIESREDITFEHYAVRDTRTFTTTPELDFSETTIVTGKYNGEDVYKVEFRQGESIETSGRQIYIKIVYDNEPFVPLATVYVRLTDAMIQRDSFNTQVVDEDVVVFAYCFYEASEPFYLYYSVVD